MFSALGAILSDIILVFKLCVYVLGTRVIIGHHFSPPTMWVSGLKLRWPDLTASNSPADSSHQLRSLGFGLFLNCYRMLYSVTLLWFVQLLPYQVLWQCFLIIHNPVMDNLAQSYAWFEV